MLTTASLVVLAGALAGGFASGLAGFGTGLVALGIWLHAVQPVEAATLVAVCSVFAQLQTLPSVWHTIELRRVAPMIVAGLIGVPVGAWLVTRIDPELFRLWIGIFLVAFSGLMLLLPARPLLAGGGRGAESAVGLVGGVMGGLAGLSGPPPILWAALKGWGKPERRAVFQAFNLTILAATLAAHLTAGTATVTLGWHVLTALPGTMIGAWLGLWAYRRLSDVGFHRIVLILLVLSGLGLILPRL